MIKIQDSSFHVIIIKGSAFHARGKNVTILCVLWFCFFNSLFSGGFASPLKGLKYAIHVEISRSSENTFPNSVFSMHSVHFLLQDLKYAIIFSMIFCDISLIFSEYAKSTLSPPSAFKS